MFKAGHSRPIRRGGSELISILCIDFFKPNIHTRQKRCKIDGGKVKGESWQMNKMLDKFKNKF
jgi:hypothetical protein